MRMNWMKRTVCMALSAVMLLALSACGGKKSAEWSRSGFYQDENENFLSVTWMDTEEETGWYVGCMLGENSYGGMVAQESGALSGTLLDLEGDELAVTVTEEGENGLLLKTQSGETYHFEYMDVPEATHSVSINTEGIGQISYAPEGEELVFDDEYPYSSAQINLAEAETYTIGAKDREPGWVFKCWTKDGEEYTKDAVFTAELAENAAFVAVFEYDPFVGSFVDENGDTGLEITRREDGTYDVKINIVRLTSLDDGVGTMENDKLRFTATDANGNPISGEIEDLGLEKKVTFTDSTWGLLENGSTFTYSMSMS